MSHQPYENWLLDENPLTETQSAALDEHLQQCATCVQLKSGWESARWQLEMRTQVEAEAGFSARWLASLEKRRARDHALQTRRLFISLGITSLALLVLWLVVTVVTVSPASMLAGLIQTVLSWIVRLQQFSSFFSLIPSGVSISLVVVLSVFGGVGLSIMAAIWAGIFWKVSSPVPTGRELSRGV